MGFLQDKVRLGLYGFRIKWG